MTRIPHIAAGAPECDPYYLWRRDDVLRHVPVGARNVLSIGCGAGVTEVALVAKGMAVTAIELNPASAREARTRGIRVIEADATGENPELAGQQFDCLIYADVLEHFRDPVQVLQGHLQYASVGATVIVTVPNFRHYSVLWQLFVRGLIQYRDAGILDRTHLRITTRRMVCKWLDGVGVHPTHYKYQMPQRREKLAAFLSFGMLQEFVARQVMVVGQKVSA
jgi:2-polyprenyl-3-methyl-5-hydroxy-6-metoxy-1,4-benzoquinol methylase